MTPAAKLPNPFPINGEAYAWYMGLFRKMRERVALNLKLHGDKQWLHEAEILLFNHFVHLETTVPPYIVFEETGAYCRSVAHASLFANARFGRILTDAGAIPHDRPDLFPLLAAEILRGRKVVIFPEGGLVRDRRVVDDQGRLGVYSERDNVFRPLHRGAAALALTLDLFKARLRQIDRPDGQEAFARWAEYLEVSPEALRAAVARPTTLLPATITFYPIRIDDNFLTRLFKLVSGKKAGIALDEMTLQGNILFKDTDMDVQLGEPILVQREAPRWQTLLLERSFQRLATLDDLFRLREVAATWSEKVLAQLLSRETDRLRDVYMERLYRGIMVNQSHLAARLVTTLAAEGRVRVPAEEFHRALYLAVKGLQNTEGLHLHRSLTRADLYRGLLEGDNPSLQRFWRMCEQAGLGRREGDDYVLTDKVRGQAEFRQHRLVNPVAIYANEVAPLPQVQAVVAAALGQARVVSAAALARLQFEDELRSYEWRRKHFDKPKYQEINGRQKRVRSGEPYLLMPKAKGKGKKLGVLLVHGFLSSPAQLREFADELQARGYAVLGVRLAGHGTSPWDLHQRSWQEWLDSVRRGYRILSGLADEVVVVGFSTGAALTLHLAAEKPARLAGVVSVSAPLIVEDKNIHLVTWISRLNKLTARLVGEGGVVPFYASESEEPDTNYLHMPVQAINELKQMMERLPAVLPRIDSRVLVLQGDKDNVVNPRSAQKIFAALGTADKTLRSVPSTRHNILREDVGKAREIVEEFIGKVADGNA
jgi:esterase/lipase/1-acyl-sn-glycerol-3-phosphate acyltransferase